MTALRVAHLGLGALAGAVREQVVAGRVRGCEPGPVVRSGDGGPESALTVFTGAHVVVEAAGVEAARGWLGPLLALDLDVVLCSCAVLADREFEQALRGLGGTGRVIIPTGAIGGLDVLGAAARASEPATTDVALRTTKTPAALGIPAASRVTVFTGSARDAARAFPKTANVSVTLALATTGLDRVRVEVVADPMVTRTEHRITMRSDVGDYEISAANTVDPSSGGRTSAVTAWSVVQTLEALAAGHGSGLLVRDAAGLRLGVGAPRR